MLRDEVPRGQGPQRKCPGKLTLFLPCPLELHRAFETKRRMPPDGVGETIHVRADTHPFGVHGLTARIPRSGRFLTTIPPIFRRKPRHGSPLSQRGGSPSCSRRCTVRGSISWKVFLQDGAVSVRHIRVTSKAELKKRLQAYFDEVNRDPAIHKWTYKIDKAA